jgi:hypothetical protein
VVAGTGVVVRLVGGGRWVVGGENVVVGGNPVSGSASAGTLHPTASTTIKHNFPPPTPHFPPTT